MFSVQHFTYGVTQSIGDTAIAYSLTAARWGVLAWDWYVEAFFSPAAQQRYRLAGEIIGHLTILAVIAGRMARLWCDDLVAKAETPVPAEPTPAPVAPVATCAAAMTTPAVVLTVPVPARKLGVRELRKMATSQGHKGAGGWTKAKLLEVLDI